MEGIAINSVFQKRRRCVGRGEFRAAKLRMQPAADHRAEGLAVYGDFQVVERARLGRVGVGHGAIGALANEEIPSVFHS